MPSVNLAQRAARASPSKNADGSTSAPKAGGRQSPKPQAVAKSAPVAEFQRQIAAFLSPSGNSGRIGGLKELREARLKVPQKQLRALAKRLVKLADVLEVETGVAKQRAARRKPRSAPTVTNQQFLAKFTAEADASQQKLIAQKALLNTAEMEQRLHISKQAISKAVSGKKMFAIVGPSGNLYYPAFYADARYDRRVLEKISKALGDVPAGSKYHFFTSPKASLGNQSPLEALAAGQVQQVLAAAAAYAGR